jgi:hypothetical protein
MSETPFESPAEDVAEQRAEVMPDQDSATPTDRHPRSETSWEANPADAAEQEAEVPIDEDEWR